MQIPHAEDLAWVFLNLLCCY